VRVFEFANRLITLVHPTPLSANLGPLRSLVCALSTAHVNLSDYPASRAKPPFENKLDSPEHFLFGQERHLSSGDNLMC